MCPYYKAFERKVKNYFELTLKIASGGGEVNVLESFEIVG
jgi:hypothetical protein